MFDFSELHPEKKSRTSRSRRSQLFESETNVSERAAARARAFSVQRSYIDVLRRMVAHFVKRAGIAPELENQLRENDPQIPQMNEKTLALTGLADRHGR